MFSALAANTNVISFVLMPSALAANLIEHHILLTSSLCILLNDELRENAKSPIDKRVFLLSMRDFCIPLFERMS